MTLFDPWLSAYHEGIDNPADCPLFDAPVADLGRPSLLDGVA